ncbi:TetR/AcrR family transcriptional regulator [Streptomyces chartreusis]|uniref:TetR/AcrR family transcriptional regulator n=1 Tax=Streptomyces chartreusis TaxID=1969 RepID=UPI003D94520C
MAYLSLVERRREFINAGMRVVAREGVARATTRRIAEEADASTASLHYCFANKAELLEAVFDTTVSEAMSAIRRRIRPDMGLVTAALEVARGYARLVRQQPDIQLVFTEMNFWALRHPHARHLASRAYRRCVDGSVQLLREACASAEESAADHEGIARQIIATVDGAALQFISLGDDVLEEIVEHGVADMLDHLNDRC